MDTIINIAKFILDSFIHIWPYLLITIPLAVAVNLSGAAKYINRAFSSRPLLSVFFATAVGAFSPFCSCGVIPVISSFLLGGVPLAPVMSFWIASPSMDPEIFFLSSSVLGWDLAVWRLVSTFIISLLAGYITHYFTVKGYLDNDVLKIRNKKENQETIKSFIASFRAVFIRKQVSVELISSDRASLNRVCCTVTPDSSFSGEDHSKSLLSDSCNCKGSLHVAPGQIWKRLLRETVKATYLVAKFMGIAFLITALITLYLPENLIHGIVSGNPVIQVILATIIGIPMYTSNITALPLAGGLIDLGLNKGAALAFLIAGATTTLPAMVAVWGITKRKVFLLYLSYVLVGALVSGLLFNLISR